MGTSELTSSDYKIDDESMKALSYCECVNTNFHTPQQDKDNFYADLQRVVDQVSKEDILVVMGDWECQSGI